MDEKEYEKFMTYLYNEYVRPRRTRLWRHFCHPDVWELKWEGLKSASNLIRFINRNCQNEDEIYRTITLERIERLLYEVSDGVSLNNRLTKDLGFLDAFDEHYEEIVEGMKLEHIPRQEIDIMRDLGSEDPEAELSAWMYILKSRRHDFKEARKHDFKEARRRDFDFEKARRYDFEEARISYWLRQIEKYLDYQCKQREELKEMEEKLLKEKEELEGTEKKLPKKSKPWFTSLGQIAQGGALSIANIGLAIGVFSFPVAAETAGWGALVSSITGVGMMLNGVGKFLGE